jgi:hypothetical protein
MHFDPTHNYGHTNLSQPENLCCWKFGELLKTLITLSSPAERQLDIMGAGLASDEMAEDFYRFFSDRQEFLDRGLLAASTLAPLQHLNDYLDQRSGDHAPDFWDEQNLATHPDWQNVRQQAKAILQDMGFEGLDLAFERKASYETGAEGKLLLVEGTWSWLVWG